MDISEGI